MAKIAEFSASLPPVVGPKRKNKGYTKSKKFLDYHAGRKKATHASRLQTYADLHTGIAGSAAQVKRLQNKLKWCKEWARKIENKSKAG